MVSNSIITNSGKSILIYRGYTENGDLSATEYLAPTQFKVGINQADVTTSDNDLTSPVIISGADYVKDFVSGYPTFDYSNGEVTIRCYLSTSEANGNDINAIGIFNEDSSPLMSFVSKFTAESKSSSDEFVFVIKNRII
jgi:hypothetical protein